VPKAVTYPASMREGSTSSNASSTASEGSSRVRLRARQSASSTASIASSLGDGRLGEGWAMFLERFTDEGWRIAGPPP
jgi:hypothetical protein